MYTISVGMHDFDRLWVHDTYGSLTIALHDARALLNQWDRVEISQPSKDEELVPA
jgi:hypothetical protein